MPNQFTVTNPQQHGQPIINGRRALLASHALSAASTTHAAWDVSQTDLLAVYVARFGTLTADCTLRLEATMDGSNYKMVKSWTNAQIADANGIYETIQIHAISARMVLTLGTMTGSNGVTVRALA
jgi:hypothetical protein